MLPSPFLPSQIKSAFIVLLGVAVVLSGCTKIQPTKRYEMTGKVISIDANKPEVIVDSKAIPGYMDAMAMSYPVKDALALKGVAAGDEIFAELIVQGGKYWIENIHVTKKSTGPPPQASQMHIPQPGDKIPDFALINQSGRKITLDEYRGKVLLVTFIYTRCPFPDYCPRISSFFAEMNRQMLASPELAGRTHLLSISFDPAHDTPAVLRKYGETYLGDAGARGFAHWDFAVPRQREELQRMAEFFGLTIEQDSGLITHSMSTTVVGPDGRIFRWYHGSDWRPDDLLTDVKNALQTKG